MTTRKVTAREKAWQTYDKAIAAARRAYDKAIAATEATP